MFELRVLNGLHQGAALPLVGEEWSIGSAEQQDLALDDPGVESLHCRLQRLGDSWTLSAEEGAVHDEDGNARHAPDLNLNSAFMLGSVWLCVSSADDAWPSVPAVIPEQPAQPDTPRNDPPLKKVKSRSQWLNRTTGIIAGLLVGVIGSAWSLTRPSPVTLDQGPAHIASATPAAQDKTHPASEKTARPATDKRVRLSSADAVRHQLNSMLSDRLLTDVSIEETPDGLMLNGNLKEESLLVYQRMLQRFKDRYESPVTVLDNVSGKQNTLPFVVVQIMTGPHAHLVTADGRRVYVGDEVDGLRLTRIDDQHLQFDGDRHIEVTW
ncbi:Type III secretion protein HrpQ [Pseudomonas caricapapayae]|uniref:Type III secretion protein HrpQ n=1 Tax=Pseudomonas caricapapayae TaxID=46678 RepID=A0A0P9JZD1_9PSED|nr:type III secretion system inner membrane ring subunit SctD [Pseudomonas caricapapayae]KAA8695955.1 EscD/YscD/HrpQ family type III secretion system inner membrane ring protein [Pseudomonas caricapapayae]KPW55098.1 Type III secretion protein HrpQ [Pseudomonas caricapapayae]RMM13492.1 Type III secretion protein HrpQ [Pseudomonas caricapapayae]RMV70458.1 Type III secretion protein HrpQ [Pseudomonas caricapapayae]RMV94502.1 Type III secretion protein HrpQ [Pseudomonas caricapapayae]